MAYKSGISICITAYKAKDFIKETLDSIAAQTWFKNHDNWEVIIGVDGCKETQEYLKTIIGSYKNTTAYMMNSNKGTYVTSNTIISLAKYDGIIRFDSDDLMLPNLVSEVMAVRCKKDVVRLRCKNFGANERETYATGEIYVRHTFFDEFGGYRAWPCGGDSDFLKRVAKFARVEKIDKVLIKRRLHKESLTRSKKTGWNSDIRKRYQNLLAMTRIYTRGDAIISMIKNSYRGIFDEEKPPVKKKKPTQHAGIPGGNGWNNFFAQY